MYHKYIFSIKNFNIFFYLDTKSEYDLPDEAESTGDFILFLGELFDTFNGNTETAPYSKRLKGGITKSSGHDVCWLEGIKILNSIKKN